MERDTHTHNSDEIDLGDLLLKLTRVVSRHRRILVVFVLVGLVLSFIYNNLKSPVFESSMMLRSAILTEAYSETLTDNLKKLIDERNDTLLSKKLNITVEQAGHLKDIKVESVEDTEGAEGATKNYIFLISVEITDNGVLPMLEIGIMNFLESNTFVHTRIELKRKRLNALLTKVNNEIKEIDSLKMTVNRAMSINSDGGVVVLDPTNVYSKALALYKEELSYQESLALIDSIQLIEGFTPFNRPVSPRLSISLASGLGLAILIAVLTIFIIETQNFLKALDKRRN